MSRFKYEGTRITEIFWYDNLKYLRTIDEHGFVKWDWYGVGEFLKIGELEKLYQVYNIQEIRKKKLERINEKRNN